MKDNVFDIIERDKSTLSFLYSKKDKFGIFFSELFIYSKIRDISSGEIVLKLKCSKKSSCKIYITDSSVRFSFVKNYLGRFKFVNNEQMLYFKANFGRKILDVNLTTDRFKKSFKDDIINQPDLYNQLHEEKLKTLNEEPLKSLYAQVKRSKVV